MIDPKELRIGLLNGMSAIVDECDYEELSKHKWSATKCKSGYYATRRKVVNGKLTIIRMHRQILGVIDPMIIVDHKNHNTLDNRRINIRIATNAQNQMNKHGWGNVVGKGISIHKPSGKYRARITVNGKVVYLGMHLSPNDAQKAYDTAAKQYFGDFALTGEELTIK